MPIELIRIDDRLIHGQVVIGWCPYIQPDHLVLCNDEVANNEWEREIYKEAASDYQISICSVDETVKLLQSKELKNKKIFIIVDSPGVVVQLLNLGIKIDKVNVGGMHYQAGKRKIAPFIYVDDEDITNFRFLKIHDIELEGRDVPICKSIDIAKSLGL
ncbi:MAG: PTS system mannose/fructose/N-acetylgalactosamine-transporter subunit IIB [bacterium]